MKKKNIVKLSLIKKWAKYFTLKELFIKCMEVVNKQYLCFRNL